VRIDIRIGDQFKPEFEAISPNNRMPAMVDPDGPDGEPISVFESGAILQYLARKSGRFYGAGERGRSEVEQWLYWQVGGLGPMAGQANHFRSYAPIFVHDQRQLAYGAIRYSDELHRLYGVMNRRLADRDFLAGDYSIADMAAHPWARGWDGRGILIDDFPNVRAWLERVAARDAVQRAYALAGQGPKFSFDSPEGEQVRATIFGQRAR